MASTGWAGDGDMLTVERKDIPSASCMAVSRDGQHALLASRRLLVLVDLQRPDHHLRALSWHSKYDAGSAAWSRAAAQGGADLAVTYNTAVEVFRCSGGDIRSTGKLQSHRRTITDLDWHWSEPLLATCSVDTNVHLWDVREPRRPVATMRSVESACQVKWNRISSQTLASSHEGDIRVWDRRKLSIPERYISAHTAKIHGLDWSPNSESQLATASQDMYVKFIDVTNPRNIASMPKAKDPVWRARYTPFGSGLVTVAVPQLRRGDNYCLCLWNTASLAAPQHTFAGHSDVVLEFDWRQPDPSQIRDDCEYELLTWSRDQTLRLWPLKADLLQACGHELAHGVSGLDTDHAASPTTDGMETSCIELTSQEQSAADSGPGSGPVSPPVSPQRPAPPRIWRAISEGPPASLEQEFLMINKNIDNVRIEKMSAEERCCTVSVVCGSVSACLRVTFPLSYPSQQPEFRYLEGTRLSAADRQHVKKAWELTAEQHVKRNRSCLEPCLRNLAASLQRLMERQEETAPSLYPAPSTTLFPSANLYGSFKDVNVAFPRTSGARFCGNGMLVVFACPAYMKRLSSRGEGVTPRSLSALDAYLINYAQGASYALAGARLAASPMLFPSLSRSPTGADGPLYGKEAVRLGTSSLGRRPKAYGEERARPRHPRTHTNIVLCYDASRLMPLNRELAERYLLGGQDFSGMCSANASLAASVGRKDLEKVWNLIGLVGDPGLVGSNADPDAGRPWAQHPFGRRLVESVISHYLKMRDVQTVAMLCCLLGTRAQQPSSSVRQQAVAQLDSGSLPVPNKWWMKPGESPYHTVHPTETRRHPTLEGLGVNVSRQNRSNSWSDVLDESRLAAPEPGAIEQRFQHDNNRRLLDPARQAEFDRYKRIYADILYRWQLTNHRAQVLKYVSTVPVAHCGLEVRSECSRCGRTFAGSECPLCRRCTIVCVICHVSVKGMSSFCLVCGHGGHLLHMLQWFRDQLLCPTGCGCRCAESLQQ
ncbi:GATOR complex protein WDR59-like isoform X1 [Amphibalanus amphitrite]|uniref:GATOR complex protein WDR59-like isoform X1 n=1 Tax=Amphibalanus amphitrite TaxID=1232801 RepID=UPI001C926219|nr:GATOR complex protein WDR59-like isoform X1 [Amphibalanus amphitrite]XP_043237263.1 GATOR complex protein WDR59-like isoform X1 [Amphibalanus amphitrite]